MAEEETRKPRKKQPPEKKQPPPAKSFEARENQLISAAVDLAEKQILAGTASAQVITHYLKLASTRERLEKEKLVAENKLLKAKADAIASTRSSEEVAKKALNAMMRYTGQRDKIEEDDEDL